MPRRDRRPLRDRRGPSPGRPPTRRRRGPEAKFCNLYQDVRPIVDIPPRRQDRDRRRDPSPRSHRHSWAWASTPPPENTRRPLAGTEAHAGSRAEGQRPCRGLPRSRTVPHPIVTWDTLRDEAERRRPRRRPARFLGNRSGLAQNNPHRECRATAIGGGWSRARERSDDEGGSPRRCPAPSRSLDRDRAAGNPPARRISIDRACFTTRSSSWKWPPSPIRRPC